MASDSAPSGGSSSSSLTGVSSSTPWLVILAFTASLGCLGGAIAIVITSDGKSSSAWLPVSFVEPSVLLAILSGVFNACQTLALTGGVAIVWWRAAQKETSWSALHYIWNKGEWKLNRLWDAIRLDDGGWEWDVIRVMLAFALVVAASVASNPLLQQASKAVAEDNRRQETWRWQVQPRIKDGWVGTAESSLATNLSASAELQAVAAAWWLNEAIPTFWADRFQSPGSRGGNAGRDLCRDLCRAEVPGAGVQVNCSQKSAFVDLTAAENANATLFNISFHRFVDRAQNRTPVLRMQVLYSSAVDSSCNATISVDTCDFRSFKVAYPIVIDYSGGWLDHRRPVGALEPQPSLSDSIDLKDGLAAGPLAGLHWIVHHHLAASAQLSHTEPGSYLVNPVGPMATMFMKKVPDELSHLGACAFEWKNATRHLLLDIHDFMLRMAAASSAGSKVIYADVDITQYDGIIIYRSKREYLWPAVAIMAATVLSTASLLLGFWHLDREVTLSPLETALAIRNGMTPFDTTHLEGDKLVEDNKPVEADKLVRDNRRERIQLVKRSGRGETAESGVTPSVKAG
ncbi:hypothetical protein MAPG_04082 [Magnaporthiopsis poae ATCC 64411]|uniref:Uncharacterized protein n=1 Tax=Magnaporthiopsis poae (strain ATCC 64411 / 73-15) TaxID=644358 RepID=A0A0C4DVS1_MAGP6|nr:hypothetical protein MAPG_04082 [Magnaporthiopsis poae ATCC 64411]